MPDEEKADAGDARRIGLSALPTAASTGPDSTFFTPAPYLVDVIAGVVLAFITIIRGETLYGFSSERVDINR